MPFRPWLHSALVDRGNFDLVILLVLVTALIVKEPDDRNSFAVGLQEEEAPAMSRRL